MTETLNVPSLSALDPRPEDPLLGLISAFAADTRPNKLDLGVGVYRDDAGATPIMAAVRRAEQRLVETGETKAYEGPRGNMAFAHQLAQMALGQGADQWGEQLTGFATPGGCGALSVGFAAIARANPKAQAWISDPFWPNHPHLISQSGLTARPHDYYDAESGTADIEAMFDVLTNAKPGDAILIQGACHNPTGADLTAEAWLRLAQFVTERGLIPFIDIAYHGFGDGLDADIAPVRAFLERVPEALVSYSCSKNFGLYRDRAGALFIKTETKAAADRIASHIADIARASYSMPPAHGPAVVALILQDKELRHEWETELGAMRTRMVDLRAHLADALNMATQTTTFAPIAQQRGMFSLLPLTAAGAQTLRERDAVYLPGSGRINIAGLSPSSVTRLADVLPSVLALE